MSQLLKSESELQIEVYDWESRTQVYMALNGMSASVARSCCRGITEDQASYRDPVLTKTDFVKRYKEGEFGNASPTWNNLEDWGDPSDHHTDSKFHIRNRVAGGPTWYDLDPWETTEVWNQLLNGDTFRPVDPASLYISAMAPTRLTIFQGEVMWLEGVHGPALFYSCQRKTMREALALDGKQANGAKADALLKHFLNPISYEWLIGLLERYPIHVVEFSVYDKCWGTVPGFNTVFWEVRRY